MVRPTRVFPFSLYEIHPIRELSHSAQYGFIVLGPAHTQGEKIIKGMYSLGQESLKSAHDRACFSVIIGFSAQLEGASRQGTLNCPGHREQPRFAWRVLDSRMPAHNQKAPCFLLQSREWKPQETLAICRHCLSFSVWLPKEMWEGQGSPGEGQGPWSMAMPHTEVQQTLHP